MSQPTFNKALQAAGYQTAMIGKWHLRSEPEGFDFWQVLPGQGHYYNPDFRTPDGEVRISRPCFQETNATGAWLRTRWAAADEARRDDRHLETAVDAAGQALAAAGYHGPYGIDAFRYRAEPGASEELNVLSEINARLTMDWPLAMAD